jgi:hypothetical protein
MPSTSKKQHNFMAAIANSPAFSKKVGIPQSVGKDFTAADKGRKFRTGGRPAINKQDTQHGSMDMPFKSVRKFAGMQSGGKVKKYAGLDGSDVTDDNYETTNLGAGNPAPKKPDIVTKEELAKSGMSLRDYMNQKLGRTRRSDPAEDTERERKRASGVSAPNKKTYVEPSVASRGMSKAIDAVKSSFSRPDTGYRRMSDRDRAILDIQQQAPTQFNEGKKAGGKIKGMKTGGNVKYNFEKSGKDVEKKGMKEGSKAEMALDKKQMMGGMPMKGGKPAFMMKKGGMAGYAKGGGIESKGKTKGTVIRMASGGSVSSVSRRADGIAQRGKTRC